MVSLLSLKVKKLQTKKLREKPIIIGNTLILCSEESLTKQLQIEFWLGLGVEISGEATPVNITQIKGKKTKEKVVYIR